MSLRDQIIELKSQGLSVKSIAEKLGCTKTNIYYHITPGERERVLVFQRIQRKRNHVILEKRMRQRYENVIKRFRGRKEEPNTVCSYAEFLKLSKSKVCNISGRPVDILSPDCHVDHLIPVSKGGNHSIDNLQLVCKEANMAKYDLSMEELLLLCTDILCHNGFTVKKE